MKQSVMLQLAATIFAAAFVAAVVACAAEPTVTERIVEVEVTRQVPVERIVEREVVKEVPVEKVVVQRIVETVQVEVVTEREVVKEIPVEKVVLKEVVETVLVDVIVEHEVIKEIPVERVEVQEVVVTATPTPTPVFTPTPTPTLTPIPTSTPKPTATATLTSTPEPTPTFTPTATASATPTSTPTPTATVTPVSASDLPGYIKLDAGPDVSEKDLEPLIRSMLAMHNYLMRQGVGEPTRVYTLNVFLNQNDVREFLQYVLPESDHKSDSIGWMMSELDNHGYIYSNDYELSARLVVLLQSSRYSGSGNYALMKSGAEMLRRTVSPVWWGNDPTWLRHGSDELHISLSLSGAGLVSDESARSLRRQFVNSATRNHTHLDNLEVDRNFESHYGAHEYAFLATELLASRTGPDALLRFFDNVQLGKSWKSIFQEVFGMTVGEFYGLFDTHRNEGFPIVSVSASVSKPAPEPRYSIMTVTEEHGYDIELPSGWVEEKGRIYSTPRGEEGELFITGIDLPSGTTLEEYANSVTNNLRQDWNLTATTSWLEVRSVDERQVGGNEFVFVEYVVQDGPEYCAKDVWELIDVESLLPETSKGYRVRHQLCEREAREWRRRGLDRTRRETLESFRIITQPATYYKQFIDVDGIIIKANEMVEVRSMYNSADVIRVMMSSLRDDIRQCLVRQGAAMAIAPFDEFITTLPEFHSEKGEVDRVAGLGASKKQPVSGSDETGIMTGRYSTVLHEFAHAVQNLCFTTKEQREWVSFYKNTRDAGDLPGTYAITDEHEFFAEFSVSFFELWYQSIWDGAFGRMPPKQQLSEDFPEVFAFLGEIYEHFEPEPYEASTRPPTPTPTPIAFEAKTPEQEALVALYISTEGPHWNRRDYWLSDEPIDSWHGVETLDGRVIALHLGGNGLRGEIPPELGNLTQLRELWFGDGNNLTGELPPELSSLASLEVLDLGYSDVSGSIPAWLGELTRMRSLYLDGNQFEGELPEELGNLVQLELLTLHDNRGLTGELPDSLTKLQKLEWFPFHATGLCAPLTDSIQAWLNAIPDWQGNDCSK